MINTSLRRTALIAAVVSSLTIPAAAQSDAALSVAFEALSIPLATMAQLKTQSAPAADAPPARWQWASKDCQRIPCRIVDAEPGINESLQGPPQLVDMPKGGPEGKMLLYPTGRVEFCFNDACSKTSGAPMTPSEARKYLKEEYAEQKRLANNGSAAFAPPAGTKWASKDCQRIPCAIVDVK